MLGMGAERELPTVLLIDEEMISREVVATLLTLNGYTLHTATQRRCRDAVAGLRRMPSAGDPGGHAGAGAGRSCAHWQLRERSKADVYFISEGDPGTSCGRRWTYLKKPVGPEDLRKASDAHQAAVSSAARIAAEPW